MHSDQQHQSFQRVNPANDVIVANKFAEICSAAEKKCCFEARSDDMNEMDQASTNVIGKTAINHCHFGLHCV